MKSALNQLNPTDQVPVSEQITVSGDSQSDPASAEDF